MIEFRNHMLKRLGQFGLAVVFTAVALVLMHWLTAGQDDIINAKQAPTQVHKSEVKPSLLDNMHDICWTGKEEALADLPGSAIIRWNKSGEEQYVINTDGPKSFKIVDSAFAEALSKIGYGPEPKNRFDVVALCL